MITTIYFQWPDDSCGYVSCEGATLPAGASTITQQDYDDAVATRLADAEQERVDRDAARQAAEAGAQIERDDDYAALVAAGIPAATAARITGGGP